MEFPIGELFVVTLMQIGWGVLAMGGIGVCWYLCEKAMKKDDDDV